MEILREKLSSRGGGVEISLDEYGFKGHRMAAYQNYLGGGMLGAIQVNDTIRSQVSNVRLQLRWSNRFAELDEIGRELMAYLHERTNHVGDKWEEATLEELQKRPSHGY